MLYDKKWDTGLPNATGNFKTAAELGLRDLEYRTLLRLLPMFEQGKIPEPLFTMRCVGRPECGTPGCIIGWGRTLEAFFCCPEWSPPNQAPKASYYSTCDLLSSTWARATPADAAIALRNYLTTGQAKWAEVLNRH